ncbi:MAG: nucleotidyltransferase domain-containing protein [Halobacteriaceae archaeon]
MIPKNHETALREITTTLESADITWAITGSVNFALQGLPVEPNDIDIQTDRQGAYAFEDMFSSALVDPVSFTENDHIRSHFGRFRIAGIEVEVMGDIEKRRDGEWIGPIHLPEYIENITYADMKLPVLALSYEYTAYKKLGRDERANLIKEHLENREN